MSDRTAELYEALDAAKVDGVARVEMHLDQDDYVLSVASSQRRIYGPADLVVTKYPDGIDMRVH